MYNKVKRSILPVLALSVVMLGGQFATATTASAATAVKAITSGGYHVLALKTDGTVYAWGDNTGYQLGDGTSTSRATAEKVKTSTGAVLTGITQLAAKQYHSLALKSDGTVWAWGHNAHGQLGTGNTSHQSGAKQVLEANGQPLSNVTSIATGGTHSIALKSDGTVWAWGSNTHGQLGIDTATTISTKAIQITALDNLNVESVYADLRSTYAVTSTGEVYAWGQNEYGQLGNGTTTDRFTPERVDFNGSAAGYGDEQVVELSTGINHVLALDSDNQVWAWGYNSFGQLAKTPTSPYYSTTPALVPNLNGGAAKLSRGGSHHFSLVLGTDKQVWGFGDNRYGQLGEHNTDSFMPDPVGKFSNVRSFTAGTAYTIVLKWDGSVWGIGDNTHGTLGTAERPSNATPVAITIPEN